MDTITYTKDKDGLLEKTVVSQQKVTDISAEIFALEKQVSDMKAGVTDTPEDQQKIDDAVLNYEAEVAKLKTELTKTK